MTVALPTTARPSRLRGRRLTRLAAVLFWTAVAVNGAALAWLWLRDGGITQIHSAGALATSAGRVTGLLGAYALLVQLLLLARLPPLERTVGFDRLTVWHRRNAKLVIVLVLAHVVLITLGYAALVHGAPLSQFSSFLDTYPGMVTATIGTGLLLLIVASSLLIVRRRLPYESWYAVHLLTYAAVYLGYLHQIPTGNEFAASTTQADWWLALYIATGVLLGVFRVLRPAATAWRHRLRVLEVTRETPTTVSIRLGGRRLDRLGARGGQFLTVRFLSRGRWWQSHPFSLSALPTADELRITVKAVGAFTAGLADLAPGTRVLTEGPFGRFGVDRRRREKLTLIGGGIGITPLRAMLEELDRTQADAITVIHRVISDDERALAAELAELAEARGARLLHLVGDHRDPAGADRLSAAHLRELVPDIETHDVFLCGPPAMMDHVTAQLRAAGVPRRQIHRERFTLAM